MNGKERILTVMRGTGLPDRVPVNIGITEGYPVRFTTGDYLEFYHYNPVPLWKARADTELRFGGDNFVHHNPELREEYRLEERTVLEEKRDYILYRNVLHSPEGELFSTVRLARHEGWSVVEPYVKDLKSDFPKLLHLLPDPGRLDFDEYREAYEYVGDSGTLAPCPNFPIDWISSIVGGPEKMILARFDYPEVFREVVDLYTDWSVAFLEEFLRRGVPMDVIQMGAALHSYSVTSPEFFDQYGLPYLARMLDLERRHPDRVFLQQHTCGKSRGIVEQCHAAGLRAIEPLEGPPMGDVDLAEVKARFGRDMCLKGNIDPVRIMLKGSPHLVREETKKILGIGMPGGRFFCGIGDQIPYQTPPENVEAFVETAHAYGKYR